MSPSRSHILLPLIFFIIVFSSTSRISNASPVFDKSKTIRSLSKRHVSNNGNRDTESTSLESCGESLVCGHAYYDSSFAIMGYRRSNRCICEENHRCVLTNNLSDRKAYVFKCRSVNQSENMFPFPDNPHHSS